MGFGELAFSRLHFSVEKEFLPDFTCKFNRPAEQ
jgi:hypothetical protein